MQPSPAEVMAEVQDALTTLPACLAGSVVSAETYGLPLASTSDVDVFCYNEAALFVGVQRLLDHDFYLEERHAKVWHRWLAYGFARSKMWHTNSIKLISPLGREVNLIHKLLGRQPLSSLSQVLESFDFGLLATGYDLQLDQKMDLRPFLFPGYDIDGPLPLMPNKRDHWRQGFISQYNGLREMGRYAKYARYGHDLSLVRDDLVLGYQEAALYLQGSPDPDRVTLGGIYQAAAFKIEDGDLDDLEQASSLINTKDSLDQIMEALE